MSKLSITVKVAITASQFAGEHECNFQSVEIRVYPS